MKKKIKLLIRNILEQNNLLVRKINKNSVGVKSDNTSSVHIIYTNLAFFYNANNYCTMLTFIYCTAFQISSKSNQCLAKKNYLTCIATINHGC